jgi:TonB family protein
MIRVAIIFLLCLVLLPPCALAQTGNDAAAQSGSAELARAKQLNASMVEMFGKGKYDEALSLAKKVLDIIGNIEGKNALSYANALHDVATIYMKKLKYDEGIDFQRQALSLYEKLLGADSPNILIALYELAVMYDTRHAYDKAEPLYGRAVAIKERLSGFNDLDDAQLLLRYACTMNRNQKKAEAAPIEARALNIIVKEKGPQVDTINFPGECLGGKALELARPHYPAEARAARASGTVEIEILIDETGKVISARAMNGPPMLREAAVQASYKARFEPTIVAGKAFKAWGKITYNFVTQ